MRYSVGDRVVSLIDDSDGLSKGELGTVVKIQEDHFPVIRWDEFNPVRHDADGSVPYGHGWYIFSCNSIDRVCDMKDFGDIPRENTDAVNVLLGL